MLLYFTTFKLSYVIMRYIDFVLLLILCTYITSTSINQICLKFSIIPSSLVEFPKDTQWEKL